MQVKSLLFVRVQIIPNVKSIAKKCRVVIPSW